MTGLLSTPLQGLTAARGPHAHPESMCFGSPAADRLKGSFQEIGLPASNIGSAPD